MSSADRATSDPEHSKNARSTFSFEAMAIEFRFETLCRKHPAQKKQIAGVHRFLIGAEPPTYVPVKILSLQIKREHVGKRST